MQTSNLSSSRLGVTSLCPVPNAAGVTHPVVFVLLCPLFGSHLVTE